MEALLVVRVCRERGLQDARALLQLLLLQPQLAHQAAQLLQRLAEPLHPILFAHHKQPK